MNLETAIARFKLEGERGLDWAFCCATKVQLDDLDTHLVAVSHDLAFQPGTQEQRFRAYVRELAQEAR